MSRSLSATDKTMAAYFAALMADEPVDFTDDGLGDLLQEGGRTKLLVEPEPSSAVMVSEPLVAEPADDEGESLATPTEVHVEPLKPLPARPPRPVVSEPAAVASEVEPQMSAEERANAAMVAQYASVLESMAPSAVTGERANLSAEERANAAMLAQYGAELEGGDAKTTGQPAAAMSAEERANAEMLARYADLAEPEVARTVAVPPPASVPPRNQAPARAAPEATLETAVRTAQPVEKLLAQVSAVQREVLVHPPQPVTEELSNLQCILEDSGLETLAGSIIPPTQTDEWLAEDEFQTLYFEVAGLTLALPLRQLGGIHRLEKINKLIGKPDWFLGVMTHRDAQLHVVDTARWVMPEKYTPELAGSLNYQYLIMLDDSPWGLACERLITAATVRKDAVKWRENPGKRPWLAGLVIERMCALVNVSALIGLLSGGMGR